MNHMKDRFDTEVTVGCTVAYPGRQGSSVWISTGMVTEILADPPKDFPSYRAWTPKIKLTGGTTRPFWTGEKQDMGNRSITWTDNVIVLKPAG